MAKYVEGRLKYNSENQRYGMVSIGFSSGIGFVDVWEDTGFSCDDYLEIWMDGKWFPTYMRINRDGEWYLMNTPYTGDLDELPVRILRYFDIPGSFP